MYGSDMMIMYNTTRKEDSTDEQEITPTSSFYKNAGLAGDQNNSTDQPILEPECNNPNCQICFGINGEG